MVACVVWKREVRAEAENSWNFSTGRHFSFSKSKSTSPRVSTVCKVEIVDKSQNEGKKRMCNQYFYVPHNFFIGCGAPPRERVRLEQQAILNGERTAKAKRILTFIEDETERIELMVGTIEGKRISPFRNTREYVSKLRPSGPFGTRRRKFCVVLNCCFMHIQGP